MYMCICICACICICTCNCICICIYIYVYKYIYVQIYIYTYIYILCIHIYMHIYYKYACMYTPIHIYIHIQKHMAGNKIKTNSPGTYTSAIAKRAQILLKARPSVSTPDRSLSAHKILLKVSANSTESSKIGHLRYIRLGVFFCMSHSTET